MNKFSCFLLNCKIYAGDFLHKNLGSVCNKWSLIITLVIAGGCFEINTNAIAGEHIEVVRDVVLSGVKSAVGLGINQIPNQDGYIVTGSIGGAQAWATRLDAQGQQKWSYLMPRDAPPDDGHYHLLWHATTYSSAIVLKDGSTILCGFKVDEEDNHQTQFGLLTHIDKSGNLLNQQLLKPQKNQLPLNYLFQSAPWNDGFIIMGSSTRNKEYFTWLVALDAKGNLLWEKLLPTQTHVLQKRTFLIMKDGDLVMTNPISLLSEKGNGMNYFTEITRIQPDGVIKANRRLAGQFQLVRQPNPAYAIRLVPVELKKSEMQLLTLHDDLSEAEYLTSKDKVGIAIPQALELPDHSIVLVGATISNRGAALMVHFNPDSRQFQSYTFKPVSQSWAVGDGLATGKVGEWVAIRQDQEPEGNSSIVFSFANIINH